MSRRSNAPSLLRPPSPWPDRSPARYHGHLPRPAPHRVLVAQRRRFRGPGRRTRDLGRRSQSPCNEADKSSVARLLATSKGRAMRRPRVVRRGSRRNAVRSILRLSGRQPRRLDCSSEGPDVEGRAIPMMRPGGPRSPHYGQSRASSIVNNCIVGSRSIEIRSPL